MSLPYEETCHPPRGMDGPARAMAALAAPSSSTPTTDAHAAGDVEMLKKHRHALGTQLRALLDQYEAQTLDLFAAIESGTAFDAKGNKQQQQQQQQSAVSPASSSTVATIITLLHALDADLHHTLHALALTHRTQQHTIDALVAVQRARDERRRAQIERLSQMSTELDRMVKRGKDELRETDKAEKEPLSYQQIVNYASYLSRVTSAPPGYRVPGSSSSKVTEESDGPAAAAAAAGAASGGAGQPQPDWPFPSEAQMRRGALAAAAAASAAAAAAHQVSPSTSAPARDAGVSGQQSGDMAGIELQHEPQNFPLPHPQHQHQHRQDYHYAQHADNDDAFDLDLN